MSEEAQPTAEPTTAGDPERTVPPAEVTNGNGRKKNRSSGHETDQLSQPGQEEYQEQQVPDASNDANATAEKSSDPADTAARVVPGSIDQPLENPVEQQQHRNFLPKIGSPVGLLGKEPLVIQPMDKIYVQNSNKFQRIDKEAYQKKIGKQRKDENQDTTMSVDMNVPTGRENANLEAGIQFQKMFHIFAFILQGILAGFCIANAIFASYTVFTGDAIYSRSMVFNLAPLNLSLNSVYYVLLVFCTVAALDRYDINERFPRYVWRSITFQSGGLSILLYLMALSLNSIATFYDDEFNYYRSNSTASTSSDQAYIVARDTKVTLALPVVKAVLTTWAFILLAVRPSTNLLVKHMKQACETVAE